MKLYNLLKGLEYEVRDPSILETDVRDIKIDHRLVEDGDVYIAMEGRNFDGNKFSDEAIRNGASVIINDINIIFPQGVKVKNAREAYAIMCKNYFDCACDSLKIVAVTGTNGKTTTCNTIADVLQLAGKRVGIIGTLGAKFNGKSIDTGFTTPDPYLLHSLFASMRRTGIEYVVMEASAHALELNKLDGIRFEVAVLTNITEDHLDYFGDMDRYAKAKLKLFQSDKVKVGIVCKDKAYTDLLSSTANLPILTYGFDNYADFNGNVLEKTFNGSRFDCSFRGKNISLATPLVGQYNLENALATVAVCKCLGLNDEDIKKGMSCTLPVEGRFNVIRGDKCNIIIDFAHTPDGLEKVLSTTKELTKGKIVTIFGCGGNRDKIKRPIMGEIASKYSDLVILTSDNPRYENSMDIIKDIQGGIKGRYIVIENRRDAIWYALSKFKNNETILIAGKGAEKYQEIRGVKHPYNDFDVICDYYKKLAKDDVEEDNYMN